jgi:hypothetical protein
MLGPMCSMCSMRSGFISRGQGPLQKVCCGPARMSGHNCLPGPQMVCFPGGRLHEQNEEVPQMDGSAGRTRTGERGFNLSQVGLVVYFPSGHCDNGC